MGATHTAPQSLPGSAEELLEDIVGAVRDGQRAARLIAGPRDGRRGRRRSGPGSGARCARAGSLAARAGGAWPEPLAEILVAALQVGGDGLQAGPPRPQVRARAAAARAGAAGPLALLRTQRGPQAAEHSPGPLRTGADACRGVGPPEVGQGLGGLPQHALLDARARPGQTEVALLGEPLATPMEVQMRQGEGTSPMESRPKRSKRVGSRSVPEAAVVVVAAQVADLAEVCAGWCTGSMAESGLELIESDGGTGSQQREQQVGGACGHDVIV